MTLVAWPPLLCLALLSGSAGPSQLAPSSLATAFRQWDDARNHGLGASDSTDSGVLGWREAGILRGYSDMWQATGDPHWLGKIEDQFSRMIASATDPDGTGYVGWWTTEFGVGIVTAAPLHNVGRAAIAPALHREFDADRNRLITGHDYVIEFTEPGEFRVDDQTAHRCVALRLAYRSGKAIGAIPGCTVTIGGAAHIGDEFVVRTMAPLPEESMVHEGMIGYPVAVFIEAVRHDRKLQARFGASADRFLAFINHNFLERWESRWFDAGGGAGAYRFPSIVTSRYPNRILPHNQYLAMARTFLVLQDLPGADPRMRVRAEEMARYFRRNLRADGAAWTWNYWDWMENGIREYADASQGDQSHANLEDANHATIDVGFAIEAWRRGVIFTEADVKRFAATYLQAMWNQSEENPRLGPNIATRGEAASPAMIDWLDLCRWEPKIYTLALTAFDRERRPMFKVPMLLAAQTHLGS